MSEDYYSGPVYPDLPYRTVSDVDTFCEWLVEQDPLPGARAGNSPTNVGATIEAAAGFQANIKRIDFDMLVDGKVELKSGRLGKKNPTTLVTRTFDSYTGKPYPGEDLKSRASRFGQFVKEFAYASEMTIMKGAMEGKTGTRMNLTGIDLTNTAHTTTGLFIELSEDEELLWVCEGKESKKRRLLFYDQLDINAIQDKITSQYY